MTQTRTLGIDIGGGSVKAAYLGSQIATSQSRKYKTPSRDQLCAAVRESIEALKIDQGASLRVGLCVPGRQNRSGSAVELSFHVPGLEGWAFEELVAQAAGKAACLAAVLSDAEAATRDAAGHFPDAARVLGLAIGTGVGACLLDRGEPVTLGRHGIGSVGQLEINDSGDTLESVVGEQAMRARFDQRLKGDMPQLEATDQAILALSRSIRACMLIYQPDLVLLLGGIGLALRPSLGVLNEAVSRRVSPAVRPKVRIETGTSLHHAAIGAARAAQLAKPRVG